MLPLKNIFNKILWDKRVSISDHTVTFIHRGAPSDEKTISASAIKQIGKSWFTYEDHGIEVQIPMHRILRVENLKTGVLLWRKLTVPRSSQS